MTIIYFLFLDHGMQICSSSSVGGPNLLHRPRKVLLALLSVTNCCMHGGMLGGASVSCFNPFFETRLEKYRAQIENAPRLLLHVECYTSSTRVPTFHPA